MTMKFLYAKPLGDNTCAIVVDMGNGYVVGGEVIITEFSNDYVTNVSLKDAASYKGIRQSRIMLEWAWSKGVKASDMINGTDTIFEKPEMKTVEATKPMIKKLKGKLK
jgi:hypothetical protein